MTLETKEKYTAKFLNPGKDHNFEKIPDILDHLTYIIKNESGDYERKRLSVYAKELYRIIKKTAGDSVCWRTTQDLSYEVNCSTSTISEAKKELKQSFEQLDGNSLIEIEERKKHRYDKEGKCNGSTIKHIIGIVNIWKWNNAYCSNFKDMVKPVLGKLEQKEAEMAIEMMRQAYEQKSFHNYEADSPQKRAYEADSPQKRAPQEAHSPRERINIPHKTNPLVYKTYPSESDGTDSAQMSGLKEKCLENENEIEHWLKNIGYEKEMIKKIKFAGSEKINLTAKYVLERNKKKPVSNVLGYFYKALLGEWFLEA